MGTTFRIAIQFEKNFTEKMAHRIVKVMRRQISTIVEKKVVNSEDDKDSSHPLLEHELPDENCMKTESKNFCTMTENDQKTWIALTEEEKAQLEMVLFDIILYDLGLR